MVSHISWDEGVVTEHGAAMIAIELGVYPTQETCKTKCNRRVKMGRINNEKPTCLECIKVVLDFTVDMAQAFESIICSPNVDELTKQDAQRGLEHCDEKADKLRRLRLALFTPEQLQEHREQAEKAQEEATRRLLRAVFGEEDDGTV